MIAVFIDTVVVEQDNGKDLNLKLNYTPLYDGHNQFKALYHCFFVGFNLYFTS